MIKTGSKRPLELADLGVSSSKMKPGKLYNGFEKEWEKECEKEPNKRSLLSAIIRANGIGYWSVAVIFNVLSTFLNFVPTLILNMFVKGMEDGVEGFIFTVI